MLAQLWIARLDIERASYHDEWMLSLTHDLPERTWRALALQTGARIAIMRGEPALAYQHIEQALALVFSRWILVAAWQVHATATEL
jgi:hypothetical protein